MKPDHVSAGCTKEAFGPGSADSHSIRILPHNPDCAAGFSLVEVMVAVLILGVALAGLTEGITTALSSNKESELQTTAALIAALAAALSFRLDLGSRHQAQLPIGDDLLAWFQTVLDYSHVLDGGAGRNSPYFDGHIGLDDVHKRLVLTGLHRL